MSNNQRAIRNDSGFSLISTMIGVAITAIGFAALTQVISMQTHLSSQGNAGFNAYLLKKSVVSTLTNKTAWDYTKNANASLACIPATGNNQTPATVCSPTSGGPFELYDKDNRLFMDYNSAVNGFDFNGNVCPQFGVGDCSIQLKFDWKAGCDPNIQNGCVHPIEYIGVTWKLADNSKGVTLNLQNFAVHHFARNLNLFNPSLTCANGQGVYIGLNHALCGQISDSNGCVSWTTFSHCNAATPAYIDPSASAIAQAEALEASAAGGMNNGSAAAVAAAAAAALAGINPAAVAAPVPSVIAASAVLPAYSAPSQPMASELLPSDGGVYSSSGGGDGSDGGGGGDGGDGGDGGE